jgi:mono/diheme cytochrome c family protein
VEKFMVHSNKSKYPPGGYGRFFLGAVAVFAAAALFWMTFSSGPAPRSFSVEVAEPELSSLAAAGKVLYEANCAICHGIRASGTDTGPPLVHDIYNPGHHADLAFFSAAKFGVRQHHWRYGNMPPQPQASEHQVKAIVRYVRELQIANGIRYKPHRM